MGENVSARLRFRLLAERSRFTAQAFADGFLSAFGHDPVLAIKDFDGEAEFSPESLSDATVTVRVRTNSLQVLGDIKDKDRQDIESKTRDEVLEAVKYPEAVFNSTNVTLSRLSEGRYRVRVIGDLQLHGVVGKSLWINGEVTVTGDTMNAKGEFNLKQTEFNLKPVRVAGGALKLKNEVKLTFDVTAIRIIEESGSATSAEKSAVAVDRP